MTADHPTVLRGEARMPGGIAAPATVSLEPAGFSVAIADRPPWSAAYRDVATVAVDAGAALVQLGSGPAAEKWLFERFGPGLAALARGLRDGRLHQWLSDGLARFNRDDPIELVEGDFGPASGVAQLLYAERGIAIVPLDERQPRLRIRRADIGELSVSTESGGLHVAGGDGPLAPGVARIELVQLGSLATAHRDRWAALRDGAVADMSAILAGLIPDADFGIRRAATTALHEGRPIDPTALGDAWPTLESAVLTEPSFADSYRALVRAAGGSASPRWLAVAPTDPGVTEQPRIWFLVGLPGNLVALELVSGGAHATYCFRVAPRSTFSGGAGDPGQIARAVRDVSEALIDARFLREPMAIPDAQLAADPKYLRYRLALRALPSLASARARFVARLVHSDPAAWASALDDLIRWHGAERDEAAEWPGRAAQERQVAAAGGDDSGSDDGAHDQAEDNNEPGAGDAGRSKG